MYALGTMTEPKARGYGASRDQLLARMRRIRGQVEGIERMIEDERYCIDVITQISAVEAALDKVALGLVDDHVRQCMVEDRSTDRTDELMAAVGRLMRSG